MQGLVQVIGLSDVQEFIRTAPKNIVATGFVKALSAAANVFADEVEALCPVKAEDTGGLLDKGELREQIMVEVQLDSQFRGGMASVGWGSAIPINLPLWVERGHRVVVRGGSYIDNRGHVRPGTHIADVPPHPFVLPAFDAAMSRAIEAFTESLSGTIRDMGGK